MSGQAHILFEEPPSTGGYQYSYYGSSPKFLNFLKNFLNKNGGDIVCIKLAVYLFNNFELHKTFTGLAKKGVKIDVVSIPPEGYDDTSPQEIGPSDEGFRFSQKQTKKSLADVVYGSFRPPHQDENYRLFVFPHTYIRSPLVKPFSRGVLPFSLHTKSFLVEMKNGKTLVGVSSSNLGMRDLPKHDFLVVRETEPAETETTRDFFTHLIRQSVPFANYLPGNLVFNYPIEFEPYLPNPDSLFVSPFYRNSPEVAEKIITDFILSAKKRIWVVAQHLSSFQYSLPLNFRIKSQTNAVQHRDGCLSALLKKAGEGIEIKCLSQTYADGLGNKGDFRMPVNTHNFLQFIAGFRKQPGAKYAVNKNIHSKYIIVDNQVMATTFNYTPTQFISLPFVEIKEFKNIPGMEYRGVFSEVAHLIRLTGKREVDCFVKNFGYVWENHETVVIQ